MTYMKATFGFQKEYKPSLELANIKLHISQLGLEDGDVYGYSRMCVSSFVHGYP